MRVSINGDTLKQMIYDGKAIEMDDLGLPGYFRKPPNPNGCKWQWINLVMTFLPRRHWNGHPQNGLFTIQVSETS